MRVLVLGGTGFVGRVVARQLRDSGWAVPIVASRSAASDAADGITRIRTDSRDPASLAAALADVDAVVNCVTGDGVAIADGTRLLCEAAARGGLPHLVHMSTMSVYGSATGRVREDHPLQGDIGWYGQAKIAAEGHVQAYAARGAAATLLRPGCVAGPGSPLWHERLVQWLRLGWLGDLGAAGDGWSNLVHVDDLAACALAALKQPPAPAQAVAFNVVAPDSPRWNRYFVDLAIAVGATPVRRISERQLRLTSQLLGVPLKVLERLRFGQGVLPAGIPPSLLRLWQQDIRLDCTRASALLGRAWTPYAVTVGGPPACAEVKAGGA